MKSFLTSIKVAVAALLVAILALPVAAQTQEVEMTPQLEAALQNYDSYSSMSFDGAIIVKQNYRSRWLTGSREEFNFIRVSYRRFFISRRS